MNKKMEFLIVEVEPRKTIRQSRARSRNANRLSVHFPDTVLTKEESQSRFEIDEFRPASERPLSQSPMKVLLRNAKTMKYLKANERWTINRKQAKDFRNGWWATVCAFTMNPRHLVIDYEFDDDRYNLHIPVLGNI